MRRAALLLLALPLIGACEDPLIVLGDQPGIMRRLAGVPNSAGATLDSLAFQSRLRLPRGLAVADDGTVYIADTGNERILAVSSDARIRVLASAAPGCGQPCLVAPDGIALEGEEALWIADPGAQRVFRLDLATRTLTVAAGTGVAGASPDGAPALSPIEEPRGIAVADDGTVYFSEHAGHRIRWITSGGTLRTLAGTGAAGYGGDGGAADQAQINAPAGLAYHDGTLYIADRTNNRIRAVDIVGGGIRTVAGNGVAGWEATDTLALTGKLFTPEAVAVSDDGGLLFIADTGNNRVRSVNLDSGRLGNLAGTGDMAYTGELLEGGETGIFLPRGVATGPAANVFIADTGHQIVWRTRYGF